MAQAQRATGRLTPDWAVKVDYLGALNGISFCRPNGSFYMVVGGLSAMERAATEAHERKHMEQYDRFKDCAAFYRWYDTPKGKMASEAEAFAAGWCVQVAMGADGYSLRSGYLLNLITNYVPGTPIYEVAQEFKKYEGCH